MSVLMWQNKRDRPRIGRQYIHALLHCNISTIVKVTDLLKSFKIDSNRLLSIVIDTNQRQSTICGTSVPGVVTHVTHNGNL